MRNDPTGYKIISKLNRGNNYIKEFEYWQLFKINTSGLMIANGWSFRSISLTSDWMWYINLIFARLKRFYRGKHDHFFVLDFFFSEIIEEYVLFIKTLNNKLVTWKITFYRYPPFGKKCSFSKYGIRKKFSAIFFGGNFDNFLIEIW